MLTKPRKPRAKTPVLERILRKVIRDENDVDSCWMWQGWVNKHGYGTFKLDGRTQTVHRAAYEATHGPISDGLLVLHSCDNSLCCNPDHLSTGTTADNVKDRVRKGRSAVGKRNGRAKLTDDLVRQIKKLLGTGLSFRAIGRQFGVDGRCVGLIAAGAIWKHVSTS